MLKSPLVLSSQPEILGPHFHDMGHHISADIFSVREFTSLQTILHHCWKTLIWDDVSLLGAIIHHQALFSHLFYFAFYSLLASLLFSRVITAAYSHWKSLKSLTIPLIFFGNSPRKWIQYFSLDVILPGNSFYQYSTMGKILFLPGNIHFLINKWGVLIPLLFFFKLSCLT